LALLVPSDDNSIDSARLVSAPRFDPSSGLMPAGFSALCRMMNSASKTPNIGNGAAYLGR